jgi:co-chaperonin GroES (HSP10)
MRGQVVVREIEEKSSIWTPDPAPRQVKTHCGVVIAMGPPARTRKGRAEVPHGFRVGDVVQYHFEHHQETWTMPWPLDGKKVTWLAQHNVDGVVE